MALEWIKEFPRSLVETFKENFERNFPKFKEEVSEGAKAVLQVPGKIIATVLKPLNVPLIIIGVVALLLLIFWKKIFK